MWRSPGLCCLLAVAHLYFFSLVHCQEPDSSQDSQKLTCITHDLQNVLCSWTTASATDLGLSYKFCYGLRYSSPVCEKTQDNRAQMTLNSFGTTFVGIETFNSSANLISKNTFRLREENISYVPITPQIRNLTANSSARTLNLEWNYGGLLVPFDMDATWQIRILRKDPIETVALETYDSKLPGNTATILSWSWTSDIPLECTTHYAQIRCYLHLEVFSGTKTWSEWSPLAKMPGQDTGSLIKMFPVDEVAQVGTNLTFCCVWKRGQSFKKIGYSNYSAALSPPVRLSNWSAVIYVQNANKSIEAGDNAWCEVDPGDFTGTTTFVGYPPDTPQNLSCETSDFKEITCEWKAGRPTNLYSAERRTNYTLFESISGKNVTYNGKENPEYYRCNFLVLNNQRIYNFTIHGSNPLGQSESSLLININYRVHPQTPTALTVINNSPTHITLAWQLSGNLMPIMLQCLVRINSGGAPEDLNVQLNGTENLTYSVSIDKLRPYTKYVFQVRCSAIEPFFWKWSRWSENKHHTTLEAPPARGPDVWRERSPDGETVNIFWKPLPVSEANGLIQNYEVFWSELDKSLSSVSVPAYYNGTTIDLGGNDYVFHVEAKNKAGSSPPSQIKSAEVPVGSAPTEDGFAVGDGVSIAWPPDSEVTCGYTVRWCHAPGPEPCVVDWETFPSNVTQAVIKSAHFQPGVRYTFSVLGCKDNGYQLMKYVNGYTEELSPRIAPKVLVEHTTSDSILITWEMLPVSERRGFLRGYFLQFAKGEEGKIKSKGFETELFNISEPKQTKLKISNLQGKTSYHLNLSAYTAGGIGPGRSLYVVTKENSVGLIIAIIIPVAIVVVLGLVTSILCYRKREWIKETFYPDIPNPVNCKALEFQKGPCEGKANPKTLEMNPCTPNNIEVVETQSPCLKIEDTAITSPVADELPEDGFDSETESHIVVSYCPPIIEEEISNPPGDESMGSSQVIYIDIQSMYPPQVKLKEEPGVDCVAAAGYKPQMQLPVNSLITMEDTSSAEDVDKTAGYRPQANPPTWNTGCPDSPRSIESNNENASFGSPCSINSRQFLIPPKEDEDSPKGWSFANFFHNKPND
ncbi:leukemia inhibitory factor receptor-like [Eublepharis macularius]|uniref:Leukemia inhibitory factor receptor-like n=1 Tax=Eublepharis macularius TaxID=481883 RepID=A0AA97L760_EUBMA|nr:leukemia inhibitory factor receptor-like [Eublepharis macularius]XP_054842133.1 leukemia inhibitory factor receptor-like [Eublepharis macularius]